MSRLGYLVAIACAIALLAYAFWPRGGDGQAPAFPNAWTGPFSISGEGGLQTVADGQVRVAGLVRPVDAAAVKGLIEAAGRLRCPPDRILDGIAESDALHYGVDGTRTCAAGGERRSWGDRDGVGAVHDPVRRRLFLVEARQLAAFTKAAARLDQRRLAEVPADPQRLDADGAIALRRDGHWWLSPLRPHADGRIARILALARAAQLTAFAGEAAGAIVAHRLDWDGGGLRLLTAGARTWLAADGAPPQPLADAGPWLEAFAALREDRLADRVAPLPPPVFVQVLRDGTEVLRLERQGEMGDYGLRPWRIAWPGGDEPAEAEAGERLLAALAGLRVDSVLPDAAAPPGSLGCSFTFEAPHPPLFIALGRERCGDGAFSGRPLQVPAHLVGLRPEALLDHRLCPIAPERAVKVQRRWRDGRAEVLARRPGGSWGRSLPAGGAIDDAASHRLVRALCRIRATAVGLGGAAERAAVQDPAFSLAIRFAPVEARRAAADDEVDLEDTVPTERGWACVRDGAGWLMADQLGGLSYRVGEADVEALMAPVDSSLLCPVAAPLVAAVEIAGPEAFRLERRADAWVLRDAGGERPADAVAVRRLLRAIAALAASGPCPAPATPVRTLAVETVDGERIVLRFGQPAAAGVPVATAAGGQLVEAGAAALADPRKAWF